MKLIIAVCIYNRFNNLKTWINCWKECERDNAELIIIHNYYGDEKEKEKYQNYCDANSISYIPRNGQGFDIGAFQDVCLERLAGFPGDWDYLLWCTDDCLPMARDFYKSFIEKIKEGVGITCMQISKSSPGGVWHVRTTGFCISKEISKRIQWPMDIKTKQDCYAFEHRGHTFTDQIRTMGLDCIQVAPIKESPLWDSMHPNLGLRLNRQEEFNRVWIRKLQMNKR